MNATQEFEVKNNTKRNGKSRNSQYWYSSDPMDSKYDKSSRAVHRNRLAQLLEEGAFEVSSL